MRGNNYKSLYGINKRGKVTGVMAANKQGKRLCHGNEMLSGKKAKFGHRK